MTVEIPSSVPATVPAGTRIYKDDCMFSFDTPDNNSNGLDVCLHCYQGFSRRPDKSYTHEHAVHTGHRYFLNIKKTLKPEQERLPYNEVDGERQPKIAKLEVKDIKDEDIYDISYAVYDETSDELIPLDQLSSDFKSLVESVIVGNSSGKQDEITAWEQEVFPCEHTLDLEQFADDSIDLSKCGECELSENLWICLHCGHLGCGRQQFGSDLKGNGHALEHYSLSEHPVAVKLGSLSSDDEDKADVYCYKCNDEVKVFDLAKKLMKFGINIRNAVKTEKNLIELNLDQNMNWQFQLDDVNGEKLQPVFGPGLTGMKNLGNSCYINSVVQALYSLDGFKDFLEHKSFPEGDPSRSLLSQLLKIYDGLESGRYSKVSDLKGDTYQLGIKPNTFKTLVGENHPEFKTQKQQDAYEFLLFLLDKIDNEFGYGMNQDSKFLLFNKTVCTNCNNINISPELVDNLSIPLEDKVIGLDEDNNNIYEPVDLLKCLQAFGAAEPIDGFQCDNCNTKSVAMKSTSFRTLPKVLVLNTQRIKLVNWVPVKVNVPITFTEPIDVAKLVATPEDMTYEIVSEGENSSESQSFEPNIEALEMLKATGFPENRCIKALYTTGNSDAESAMNWLIEHMEDPDIDEPLQMGASTSASGPVVSDEDVSTLMAMGFDSDIATLALSKNGNDLTRAIEWIYDNPGAKADDVDNAAASTTININQEKRAFRQKLLESEVPKETHYRVKAIICHKGSSPHTGHYVVFIRKLIDGEWKWVLFNDEKVVLYPEISLPEVSNNGYIYVLERE